MGLLDKLLKKGTDALIEGVKNAVLGDDNYSSTVTQPVYTSSAQEEPDDVEDRIEAVLSRDFSEYEVRKNVNSSEFMANEAADNYSYVLYLEGHPKLSIMVLNGHNEYAKKSVRLAHEASEGKSVPCINIMTYLPSTMSYIKEAINEKLS